MHQHGIIPNLISVFIMFISQFNLNSWIVPLTSICLIQGHGLSSTYLSQIVRTRGIVILDRDTFWQSGFYIQFEDCDSDPNTSDGIFIYVPGRNQVVSQGDEVEVIGEVDEYYGLTEVKTNSEDIIVLSGGNSLPKPVDYSPPLDNQTARLYSETLESMRLKVKSSRVVGPTDSDKRSWLVRSDLGIDRVFQDDLGGTGELICVDDSGNFKIDPPVMVGDRVKFLKGVLDYRGGIFCLQLTAEPDVISQENTLKLESVPQENLGEFKFEIATFNLANLFDTIDDPATDYYDRISENEYHRRLHKRAMAIHETLNEPEIIAVQEAENQIVLEDLTSQPEITNDYGVVLIDGPDRRGMDVGFLYRKDRVEVILAQDLQGCTVLIDGLGPDGNRDMQNPQNDITCDSDGDEVDDGNRLFSRPPLLVHVRICQSDCSISLGTESGNSVELHLFVNHWKSKSEDTSSVEYTKPRRIQQATFVADLVDEILVGDENANVIVLGDLNDFPNSQPVSTLTSSGLENLILNVERSNQYTYIYRGVSQVLDHILVRMQKNLRNFGLIPSHINADYPVNFAYDGESIHRSSDHDPVMFRFAISDNQLYLPMTFR